MSGYKIIIADDHPLFRSALSQAIVQSFPSTIIIDCDNIAALESVTALNRDADLILLDLRMPGANGFSGLALMRREFPEIPVIVISASAENANIKRAIDYGAAGFIPKSSDLATISAAITFVLQGNLWIPEPITDTGVSVEEREFAQRLKTLTPQQMRVFMMLTKGLLNKQIADGVSVSEATIRTHMTAIFRKLGVRNRTQAVLAAQYLKIDPEQQEKGTLQ